MNKSSWVVDTGASDHMTGSTTTLDNFQIGDKDLIVLMADGTQSLVKGKGSVCVADLLLESVLHVPNLSFNLLSVSKLTRDLDCIVRFFPSYCIFQDRSSTKVIGSAEVKDGLY